MNETIESILKNAEEFVDVNFTLDNKLDELKLINYEIDRLRNRVKEISENLQKRVGRNIQERYVILKSGVLVRIHFEQGVRVCPNVELEK